MSLINQMLKDLEERRPAGSNRDAVLHDIAAPRQAAQGKRHWLPWAITAALAVGVGALLLDRSPLSPQTPASVADSAVHATAEPTTPPETQPVADTGPVATPDTAAPLASVEPTAVDTGAVPALATAPTEAAALPATTREAPTQNEPVANTVEATPEIAPAPVQTDKRPEPSATVEASTPPPAPIIVTPAAQPATPSRARPSPPQVVEKTAHPLNAEQQAEILYQDGAKQLRLGRLARAEDLLREAIASSPGHSQAREAIASLLINGGRTDEALQLLAQGLALDKRQAGLANIYARLLLERGMPGEARTALEQATPPLAANPDYHALLAAVYQRLNLHQAAVSQYRSLLQMRPGQGVWWMGLGISSEALGDRTGAAQAYQQALNSGALASDLQRYVQSKLTTLQAAP